MPIHFACDHCYQLMSISSSKLGTQVICPRCQQSNTVPDEEGAAKTLAARKVAKAKAAAAAALAALNTGPASPPPLASSRAAEESAAVDDDTELVYEDELPGAIAEEDFDIRKVAISRSIIYVQGVLLLLLTLGAFGLGMMVGGGPTANSNKPQIVDRPCTLKGAITCRERSDAKEVPDRGAVILLFPEAPPSAATKLPSAGLRPSDPAPPKNHAGLRALADSGGGYARADAKGKYTLTLQHPGNYRVLIVSALARRAPGSDVPAEDASKMREYVSDVPELVRDGKYLWTTLVLNESLEKSFSLP